MDDKPDSVECSICGEMIEPFLDGHTWCYAAAQMMDWETMEPLPGRFHYRCAEHGDLWKRLRALEERCK
jgi:hypothetical protein